MKTAAELLTKAIEIGMEDVWYFGLDTYYAPFINVEAMEESPNKYQRLIEAEKAVLDFVNSLRVPIGEMGFETVFEIEPVLPETRRKLDSLVENLQAVRKELGLEKQNENI